LIGSNTRNPTQNTSSVVVQYETSDVDLGRAQIDMEHFVNPGMELWDNPHSATGISQWGYWYDEVQITDRSTEKYSWFATAPEPVNESTQSLGMRAKAVDIDHSSVCTIQHSDVVSNPLNLTLKFDLWLDEIPDSTDSDLFAVQFGFGSSMTKLYVNYVIGGTDSQLLNSTYHSFFHIDAPLKTWTVIERNVTADYFDAKGSLPGDLWRIYVRLISRSQLYSQAYVDDFNLVNGTTTVIGGATGNGNMESSGGWTRSQSVDSPADMSQTTERIEGDWAFNATTISDGNTSDCGFSFDVGRRVSGLHPDSFSFWWKLDEYLTPTGDVYAYIFVEAQNATGEEFDLVYLLYTKGSNPWTPSPYLQIIEVDNYNTSGQWYHFDRSIWEDVTAVNDTEDLIITNIEFEFYAKGVGARASMLLDNLTLKTLALSDAGYEDQGDVGEDVIGWNLDSMGTDYITVTDMSYDGLKAANLTVTNGNSEYADQTFNENYKLTNRTDKWFHMSWRLENFTSLDNELVYLGFYLEDSSFAYVFANGSNVGPEDDFDEYILLPGTNVNQTWHTLNRNLFSDFVTLFGSEPDQFFYDAYLVANSEAGGRIEFLMDDVYLYDDPAPSIENVALDPSSPEVGDDIEIAADIIDLSLDAVQLHYRLDGGSWINKTMNHGSGDTFNESIPGQSYETLVEYYISANDTFYYLTSTSVMSYIVDDVTDPQVTVTAPANNSDVTGEVIISVDATDSGSGVARVEIYISSTLVANDTTSPYSHTWDTTTESNGFYTILVRVFDNAGNLVERTIIVEVANTSTPTTPTTDTGTGTPPDYTMIIVVVAVVAGIVVISIIVLNLKKKE